MVNESMLKLGTNRSCIRELFEYGIRQAAIVGRENVYDYSIGNPSIPAPAEVNDGIVDIVTHIDSLAVHGYTPAPGLPDAREAIAAELNSRYGTALRGANIFFTCGAAPAIIAVSRALNMGGSEFIAIAPYFPEYKPYVESNGGRLVVVPADIPAFQINWEALEASISERTQGIFINTPNNPSGVIYTVETLRRLGELLERKSAELGHRIYIIADEPYRELAYDGASVPFIPTIYPHTIVCYSFSKSLSLPGERIGYVCVPDCAEDSETVFAAVAGAARACGHVCAPALLQRVAARCAAVRPDVRTYDANRTLLYEKLTALGYDCVKPTGAFYMFVKAPGGDSKAFSDAAKKYNLLLVPGDDFGVPSYFRVCTCVSRDMILRSLPAFEATIKEF